MSKATTNPIRVDEYAPQDKTPSPVDRFLRSRLFLVVLLAALLIAPVVLGAAAWLLFREPIQAFLASQFWMSILMMALALFVILHLCAACILAERKVSAWIQDRLGPNRVGYWGVLQPIADGIKFILKEDYTPPGVDRPLFMLAPALAMGLALLSFAVVPWAGRIHWPWMPEGQTVTTQVVSLDIGLLFVLAVGSLAVYGVVLAGWASNSKYAFYGGMRASAQMLSYEVPLGLALMVILLMCGTLRPESIVDVQAQSGVWNIFLHPIAFLLFVTTALAETNRSPFDLAECEQELVAGYHTEYSAMKFAMFFLGEYAHMITSGAILSVLFLGGSDPIPFAGWLSESTHPLAALLKYGVIWSKVCLFIALFMLIRWTIPRFRFDQLMRLSWQALVPLGLALVVAQAALSAFGWTIDPRAGLGRNLGVMLVYWLVNGVLLAVALFFAARTHKPVTGRQENLPKIDVRPASNA